MRGYELFGALSVAGLQDSVKGGEELEGVDEWE